MKPANKKKTTSPPPDTKMSPKEKEDLLERAEDFEGPSRRERHGSETPKEHEPGVARS